jgi:NAD(P)-dependent dehydrogenase (short-subunit alcohol dehydrogenase family)
MTSTRRAALITGASSGIGLAVARMLADERHDLTIVARRPQPLQGAAEELTMRGTGVHAYPADVGDEAQIVAAFAAHRERYGRLDVLVNSAGATALAALADLTPASIDAQLSVNVKGLVLAYREAAPLLTAAGAEHGNALAVNIASVAGRDGLAWLSVYAATKAAVIGFTKSMHKELRSQGIKSCAVCPSLVDTPFTDGLKSTIPAESMLRPEDVAAVIRPLLHLSPQAVVPELVLEMTAPPAL